MIYMKNINRKKAIVRYIISYGISCFVLAYFCSVELSKALWYSVFGGFIVPVLWRLWLDSDPDDPVAKAHFNASLYDTDLATGRAIAEAEKLSGKSAFADAGFHAHLYDTDRGKGALIAALENLTDKSAFSDADFNASLYNTDRGTGAIIAALENANKASRKTSHN